MLNSPTVWVTFDILRQMYGALFSDLWGAPLPLAQGQPQEVRMRRCTTVFSALVSV
jgi:hypothetical protein